MGALEEPGVIELVKALRKLQRDFSLDSVSSTQLVGDGKEVTLRWTGDTLTLEHGDDIMILDSTVAT